MAETLSESEIPDELEPDVDGSNTVVVTVARGFGVATRGVIRVATFPHRAVGTALGRLLARVRRSQTGPSPGRNGSGAPGLIAHRLGRDALGRAASAADFSPARLAADDGLAALAQALSDPDPEVRTVALEVVCEFSADRAARLLAGMIHDPDPNVRCAAAAAAARLRVEATVSSLIVALDDPAANVRAAAANAIEDITGRPVRFMDADDPSSRRQTVGELKAWWKQQRLARLTASFRKTEVR